MYLEVLLTNHYMEDNLETHLKEVQCSPKGDPLGGPPFNPPIGSFEWPILNPHMFIPPWYQQHVVQPILEPTTKLPYKKLQYPTYVKNINLDVHIKVFKKAIKANGETMEANVINLFCFTFKIFLNGEKILSKTIQIAFLKSWNKHFASDSKLFEEVCMQL
jgi:hypothetical protein